jgi:large subunit ribosomal protein L9
MATTNVLLREDIENLGGRGEVVKVRAGYARNYLLPRGLALLATKGNVKQVEAEKTALLKKTATEKSTADLQADQMKDVKLTFERKAGDEGTLFGSVTSMDIAEALKAQGYEIDRKKINLKEAIKITGEYSVPVKLHREVSVNIPVFVVAEGGTMAATEEVKEEATETAEA